MVKPKRDKRPTTPSPHDHDLVPDETSRAYALIERAAREGERVPTRGMSEDEIRVQFLGGRKE